MTDEAAYPIIRSSIPIREFDVLGEVATVAIFPDRRRMATESSDGMLRIWELKNGDLLKELEGRGNGVEYMTISRDGQLIASSDRGGYVMIWHGDTGRPLTQPFQAHSYTCSLDFSPDSATLATGSSDNTVKLWSTDTWQLQRTSFNCGSPVTFIRYSPSGELLAIATYDNIQIWNQVGRARIASFGHGAPSVPLLWTPDGKCLLSRNRDDSTIQKWDSSTWKQVGDIWKGNSDHYKHFAVNCNGTVVASLAAGNHVRLWRFSNRQTIAIFQHTDIPRCVAFSMDGKRILVGSLGKKVLEWAVPEHAWPEDTPRDRATYQVQLEASDTETSDTEAQGCEIKILAMKTAVRNACISGDLPAAEKLLTQEIEANGDHYCSYANRSVVMTRKLDWARALHDATKSLGIQPSLMGYISKGIALCGKKQLRDANRTFDIASTFTDSKTIHFIFLIKAIALFNANQHADAMRRIRELAATCLNADITLTCHIVEVYLHIQLGDKALDHDRPTEAADHFAAAVNTGTFLTKSAIDSKNYEDFAVLFGCDFTSLWQTANQKRCRALLQAGKLVEVFEAVRYMADMSDEATKASFLDWSIGLMQEMSTFRGNTPNSDTTSTPDMCKYDDDESVTLSDIDSDIDYVDDIVC